MKSISKDFGQTWSTVEDTEIPNPGTAADICVLKSGSWAIVHNDVEEGRHRLSIWLSKDEGKSWPYKKVVIEGIPGSQVRAHYPAIIEGTGGTIHLSFTNQIAGPEGQPPVKCISHVSLSESSLMK
jgi:predicted neuraminidase